mmetsp:Transcript_97975/g.272660  ORF Transcript_97975/g.272660 Transcript_97975/m.272660 type:complete len:230 (-) Transcript_97975:926-1615(-)
MPSSSRTSSHSSASIASVFPVAPFAAACSSPQRITASMASKRARCSAVSASPLRARVSIGKTFRESSWAIIWEPRFTKFVTTHAHSCLILDAGLLSSAQHTASKVPAASRRPWACTAVPAATLESARAASLRTCGAARPSCRAPRSARRAPAAIAASVGCSAGALASAPSKRNAGSGKGLCSLPTCAHLTTFTSNGCGTVGVSPEAKPADNSRTARRHDPAASAPPSRR